MGQTHHHCQYFYEIKSLFYSTGKLQLNEQQYCWIYSRNRRESKSRKPELNPGLDLDLRVFFRARRLLEL